MRHVCYDLCPIVKEQLRKPHVQAGEESGSRVSSSGFELSDVAGPSKVKQANDTSRKSKDSRKVSSGAPTSAYRKNDQYPSDQISPNKSTHANRKSDPEYRSQRISKDSQRAGENASSHGTSIKRRSREKNRKSSRTIRREQKGSGNSQRKAREFDDGAGPSGKRGGLEDFSNELQDYEEFFSAHDSCDSHCRGINEPMRKLPNEKEQQAFDEYLVHKGLPYFEDLCSCCCRCLVKQLWNDHFVNTTVISAALFAVGLKLCSDLNGWTVPNVF